MAEVTAGTSASSSPCRISVGVFEIALPLLLYYVDPLDAMREATLGHFCIARKPALDEPA